ncbi:MAG: hypothetical protein IKA61_01105, partial [Clostridia bacterium]|nr:hypothetical protein [Clostridia bacterium]
MKTRFIKILLLALCVSFALFAVSCNNNNEESAKESITQSTVESVHECDYTELRYNSTHHWYECGCGEKGEEQAHAGGTATCEELAVCDVCREAYGTYGRHNMVEGECTVCGAKESQGLEYELNA